MARYSNPQSFSVKTEDGKVIDVIDPSEETAKAWQADKTIYRDTENKQWTATPVSSVKFGDDGKIHVTVPKAYLNDKEHLASILDANSMSYLSSLYRENKDAMVTMSDGTEKKVADLVDEYDKSVKSYDKAIIGLQTLKTDLRGKGSDELADKVDLDIYQIMGANGLGSKKDSSEDSWLAIPNEILNDKRWSFLKGFDSFSADKQMVQAKEFIEKYYKLDAGRDLFSDSGLSSLKDAAAKALAKAGAGNPEDWARANAFYQFVSNKGATGDYWNQLAINTAAMTEGVARATAVVVPAALNGIWNIGAAVVSWLNPLQVYNIGGANNYNPEASYNFISDPVDKVVNLVGGALGIGTLVPDGQHFDEILASQYAERSQFYHATNESAAGTFILSYIGASVTEGHIVGKAEAQLLLNLVSIPALGAQLKGIAQNARTLESITSIGVGDIDVAGKAISLRTIENTRGVLSTGVAALTGKTNPTFFDTVRALITSNPQSVLNGALYLQASFGSAGKAYRAQAISNLSNLATYYANTRSQLEATGMTAEAIEATGLFADTMKSAEQIKQVFDAANQWYSTSLATARAFDTTKRIASVMPAAVMLSQTVFSAASKNPEAVRAILSGSASEADKQWAMQQIGLNLTAYGLGYLVSKALGPLSKSNAVERANVRLTRGMARINEAVTDATDAVKVKLFGLDWRTRTSNPTKKETLMLNQVEHAAQSWLAHAADGLEGTDASLATQRAVTTVKQVSNVITDFEPQRGVRRRLDIYHSGAFPAYNEASMEVTKTTAGLSELLDKHNIDTPDAPEALVGGSDATLGMPLDLTRYMSRLLINQQYFNMMGGKENTKLLTVADEKEYSISKDVISDVESRYPLEITNYIKQKVIPALKAEARELMALEQAEGVGRRARLEGFKEVSRFGKNGEDWFPIMRITDAQKSYEEGLKMLSDNRTMGTIVARNLKTDYHYRPGSEKMTDFVHPALVLQRRALDLATRATTNSLIELTKNLPTLKRTTKMDGDEIERVKTFQDLQPSFKKGLSAALEGIKESATNDMLLKSVFTLRRVREATDAAEKRVKAAGDALAEAMSKEEIPVTKAGKLAVVKTLTGNDMAGLLGAKSVQRVVKDADSFDKFWSSASNQVKKIIREAIRSSSPLTGEASPYERFVATYIDGGLDVDNEYVTEYRDGHDGWDANRLLRKGISPSKMPRHLYNFVKKMDKAFDDTVSAEGFGGVVVFRGEGKDFDKMGPDKVVEEKGFLSSTTDPAIAKFIAKRDSINGGHVVYDIFVPNGTLTKAVPQGEDPESELLFPRGIKKYYYGEYTEADGTRHIQISLGKKIDSWPSAPRSSTPSFDMYQKALKFDSSLEANINKALIAEYAKTNCV